jgi:methylmalonyl-CoA/ethylmalonyl-CoA epimerase
MDNKFNDITNKLAFTQIAWLVKDVEKSKTFFKEMFGANNFSPTSIAHLIMENMFL